MTDDHRVLMGALPWYAADTLDDVERRRVEAHLAGCADCRRQLTEIRRLAEIGATAPVAHALEHVAPGLLVQYAERRDELDAETVFFIEERLAACAVCRDALANLEQVGAALASAPLRAAEPIPHDNAGKPLIARLWDWASATLLRPAPALAYLLIAAVGLPVLWSLRAPGEPVSGVQIVELTGERASRDGLTAAEPITIELDERPRPVLIELHTELSADDLRHGGMAFNVELAAGGELVWTQNRDGGAFALRDNRGVLPLMLDPGALQVEQDYRLTIRAEAPGDPLNGQALFVRHLRFRRK